MTIFKLLEEETCEFKETYESLKELFDEMERLYRTSENYLTSENSIISLQVITGLKAIFAQLEHEIKEKVPQLIQLCKMLPNDKAEDEKISKALQLIKELGRSPAVTRKNLSILEHKARLAFASEHRAAFFGQGYNVYSEGRFLAVPREAADEKECFSPGK